MRHAARILACAAVAGGALLLGGLGPAKPPSPAAASCENPQSPRRLTAEHWNRTSSLPTVSPAAPGDPGAIRYSPRPGATLVLHPCSQHYHCENENLQRCPGQREPSGNACPNHLPDNAWVEIHTVYHAGPAVVPLPEDLNSCAPGPLVVAGYHARVSEAPDDAPLPVRFGPPAAEWWGSATGAKPPSCKAPAFWHFALGCDFKVSRGQLARFHGADTARPLQTTLSRDLTHVVAARPH